MRNTIRTSVMLLTTLLLPLRVLVAQETSALLLEGHQGQARVIQVQGKNYVEVEALSRITGGSGDVKWNRWIVPARRGQPRTTTYERGNGKGEKAKNDKQTFWCIRADVVRKLDRGEPEKASTALVCLLTISVESVTSLPSGDSFRQHPFRARSIVAMQPIFAIPREITSVHHSVVDRML